MWERKRGKKKRGRKEKKQEMTGAEGPKRKYKKETNEMIVQMIAATP